MMYTLFSTKTHAHVFLIISKVTPIKRVFGMLRCGLPFYVFIRQNQEDGIRPVKKRSYNEKLLESPISEDARLANNSSKYSFIQKMLSIMLLNNVRFAPDGTVVNSQL